ncbi:MAG: STAS domain-containing protein [Rhodocyclaceae bacterium]|nr:STAS domain-containing protein [Rhodocyclaceae bacterium]
MPVADDDLMDLDFTQPGAIPAKVEAKPSRSTVPPRIEAVARLFAGGDAAQACAMLEGALHQEDFGAATELAWGMLFELYVVLGRRQAFESLAIGFANKFEKSPPTWAPPTDAATTVGKDGFATVTLSGELGANAVQPLAKLHAVAGKVPGVRLDLAKVTDVDDTGCGALLETLRVFKRLKKSCVLVGGERIAALLAPKTVMGERRDEATWLLLLELYQNLNRQEDFEDTAVGYAVTFEVSPPSWEAPKAASAATPVAPPKDVAVDCCGLSGEMSGANRECFAALLARANSQREVSVDASGLRRMDIACTETFIQLLDELKAAHKAVRIRNASHLLVGLWRALGIASAATVEPRKL